jgi:hypothetical protein
MRTHAGVMLAYADVWGEAGEFVSIMSSTIQEKTTDGWGGGRGGGYR